MAKTNRRPVDKFERKQRLAQRTVCHENDDVDAELRAMRFGFKGEDDYLDLTDEEVEDTLNS